jgi:hypothetical protein
MDGLKLLAYAGLGILFTNTALYLAGWHGKSRSYKWFTSYLLAMCLLEATVEIYACNGTNNRYLSTYYLFLQFVLLGGFFYWIFVETHTKSGKAVRYASACIILVLTIQYAISPALYHDFNAFGFLVTTAALIAFAIRYLYALLSARLPFYYATIGICIYLISSSLIFASAAALITLSHPVNMLIWKINAVLFILYQLLIFWEWKQVFYMKVPKMG